MAVRQLRYVANSTMAWFPPSVSCHSMLRTPWNSARKKSAQLPGSLARTFQKKRERTCVVRVDRGSAKHLPALLGGGARVVAASGSLRACKRRALATLRRRHKAANIRDRALERMEAALRKLH